MAILSPSFAAPAVFPRVHELGLKRVREIFGLEPVEYSTTRRLNASGDDRARDLIAAFEDPEIKAVITTIGGNDQVTYIKNLPREPFVNNPKPFFGFSDNTHLQNFLWLNGIPSYYGASLFTQFAMQGEMDEFTVGYIRHALFDEGEYELRSADKYNDVNLEWDDTSLLNTRRTYEKNDDWRWDGSEDASGISWGGCLEPIDELLRHGIELPSLEQFENIILVTETSEEVPTHDCVYRVYRAFGERGILERVKGVLVGRPKVWNFDNQAEADEKAGYRAKQRETILNAVREYNADIPVIQNMDFGHTDPQIPLPYGKQIRIDAENRKVFAEF